jgi:thymidylate synthase (FAD)
MKVTLTRITEDPILAIEEAASNCYNSEPTGDGKIMKHCIKSGHTSVTEFCDFTFHIEGVSRALSHQLVRHRMASYAQRSQRYCSESGFEYVIPPSIKNNEEALDSYKGMMQTIQEWYSELQEFGIPNEDARMVLPNACETVIEVKMNLRALMNFMNERLCTCAQWEIRQLALAMKKVIVEKYPELEPYLVPKCEKYGKEFGFCNESKSRSCGRHPLIKDVFYHYHNNGDCEL